LKSRLSSHEEGATFDDGLEYATPEKELMGIAVFKTESACKGAIRLD
jgi:hypothetical protein